MPARPHRTVDRIAEILELVASNRHGMTLTEIANDVGAAKSTIQGFVNGLVHAGYLEEQGRRYHLGPAPYVLSARSSRVRLRDLPPHDELVALHERLDCSVLVGILVGRNVVYIDYVGTNPTEQYFMKTQPRRPTLHTAAGEVLLAHLGPEAMHEFLAREESQEDVTAFLDRVERIRADGLTVIPDSIASGSSAIATVLRDTTGRVHASLTIAGPRERVLREQTQLSAELLGFANCLP